MKRQVFVVSLACGLAITSTSPASPSPQSERNAALTASTTEAVVPLPTGDQVIRRVLDRSAAKAAATNAPAWAYDKLAVLEKLDGDAKVEERTEKLYRMQIVQGVPIPRLIKVAGSDLNEAEIKKENQREAAFQKQLSGRDPKKAVTHREAFITKDVIERYEFKALRREAVHGLQTVVVSFEPKSGKDSGSIQDRLLNRLAGMLWVDEATGDVAQLQVHLTKEFSIGVLGVLGEIRDCRMSLLCKPMTDGTWLPEKTTMTISARKFLSNVRFRMVETSSNFTLEKTTETTHP